MTEFNRFPGYWDLNKVNVSKVIFATEIFEDLLFPYTEHRVEILAITACKNYPGFELTIAGPDVPKAENVSCISTVHNNRAHQRLIRSRFEPVVDRPGASNLELFKAE